MVTSATDFNKKTRPSYFQIKIEKKKKFNDLQSLTADLNLVV